MEDYQSWLSSDHNSTSIFSNSPSPSSSSATTSFTSHETHNAPTLCEDSSFNSIESNSSTQTPIENPNFISHFCIASVKTTTPQLSCLAIHNNSLYAASMKEINVFDLTTFSLIETFGLGSGWAKSIAFGDSKIFTAHQDCKIRVWQVVTTSSSKQKHQLISTLPTLKDRLFNCMLAKNYVHVTRHKLKLWIEHADAISGLATCNDVGLMYSVSWDKSFKIWKTSSDNIRCVESITAHSDAVNAIVVNPIDKAVITGSADGQIKVWTKSVDSKKHHLLTTLSKHESSVNALALTLDGSVMCSGGGDRVILVWARGDESENYFSVSCSLKGHKGAILSLVHVNGVLISGSSDRTVRIWKHGKGFGGYCLATMEGHCKPVKSLVAISGTDLDDQSLMVFSGSLDGEIWAWKVSKFLLQ